ncbi:MAG: hypothetical protein WCK13_12440 [Ignavibacteriota bacterium]
MKRRNGVRRGGARKDKRRNGTLILTERTDVHRLKDFLELEQESNYEFVCSSEPAKRLALYIPVGNNME